MAKQPKEDPNPLLSYILNTPINYGVEGARMDIPTYRDPSDDFDTFEGGQVDPLGRVNFESEPDWLAKRDAEQSLYDAWGNGLIKAVGKAGTTAIEGVGALATLPFGLIKGVSSGDWSGFYDNALGDMMDGINESLADAFPNYSSRRDSTFDADFWADQFLGGAGYMAGAILGGEGIGLIGKAIGGGLKATSLLQLGKGTKIKDLVGSGSKLAQFGAKLKDPTKQLAYSLATATSEAAVEARDVKNVLYDDLFARRDSGDPALQGKTDAELMDMSRAAGNAAFAFNLPVIAASNFLTFGKALTSKYGAARKTFGNVVGDIGETAVKKQSAILSGLGRFGEGAISEGSQELAQLGISEGSKKYYLGQYSSSAQHFNSLWGSVVDETINNFGTKEGFESMFLGAILGGPTSLITGRKGREQEKKNTAAYSELLNNPMLQSLVSNLSRRGDNITQVANASAQQDGAIATGDKFGFKNSEYDVLKGLTKQAVELGGADTFIDKLEALKESDLGEFNKKFSNPEGEFATVEERNKSIDDAINTVKSVAKAYDNIIVSRPELNPLVAEKTPELTQAKRHIFDAVFDAVTNFEDIDTRENDIASQIMGLTAGQKITNIGIIPSDVGPILNQYIENTPGVDFNTFRKSDTYKENFQSKIDDFKRVNPAKATEVQTLVDDLIKLSLRREEMIKQYNEAIEQPEKIQKEAEAALEKLRKAQEEQKAEADKQAEEALKAATEVTPQPAQNPEEMLGGTPGTIVELPITAAVRETKLTLDQINAEIANVEAQLNNPALDPQAVPALMDALDTLNDLKTAKENEQGALEEEEKRQRDEIEAKQKEEEKQRKEEEEKARKKAEEDAQKNAVKMTVLTEDQQTSIDRNTFTKTMPPVDKEAAQAVIQNTPAKKLVAGLKIVIKSWEPRVETDPFVNQVGRTVSVGFEYNGVVLGYLPNPNKFVIKESPDTKWEDLTLEQKQNYFKIKEGQVGTTFETIDAQQKNLAELWAKLESAEYGFGEYTMEQLPFLEITPSLGEFDYKKKGETLVSVDEAMETLPIVMEDGLPAIMDRGPEGKGSLFINDNAIKGTPKVPARITNRYVILVQNGNKQQWVALTHSPLVEEEFVEIYKDAVALQQRILEAKKNGVEIPEIQDQLDAVNTEVRSKYFTAGQERNKKYIYANLSKEGTFTLREENKNVGVKGSEKVVKGQSGIKTIEAAFAALNKIGAVKSNDAPFLLKAGFENGGLKVNYNEEAAKAAKVEEQKEPVVTTTEDKKADIEKNVPDRANILNAAYEAQEFFPNETREELEKRLQEEIDHINLLVKKLKEKGTPDEKIIKQIKDYISNGSRVISRREGVNDFVTYLVKNNTRISTDAELVALEPTSTEEAPVVEESNKEEIKKEEEALKKLQEGKEKLEQEERELQKLLEEVEEKAKKEEEKEKLAEKVIAENVSEEDKEKIAEEENVDKAQVDSWLKDKFIKYITGGFIPKVNSTLAKVFKKLKTIVLSLFLGGSLIITSSAFSTNNDGKVTFNVENAVENLLPDTQEQWAKRFLDKQGLITIADNQIVPKAEEVVVNETPKPEKFFQIIGSVPDSYNSKDTLLSYRSQWDNSTGFRYIPTPVKKDLPSGGLKVSGVVGVGHFLLDGSAQNNYSHGNNAVYLRKAKENNEWIPVFTKQADNSVIVKYKRGREITAKDRIISPLRQMPFASIAFDKSRTAVGFKKGVNEVVKKDGEGTYLLFKNRDGYSRFSGGSVVFIFQDKYGNTIVRDFAGSLNQIENEGINITKAYNLNPNDLIIGYHDVGSFSAKPKAKDGEISSNQWEGYNPEGMTGGALLIPIEGNIQPTSSTPISSQPTKAGLNWALLLGLSTLLKKRKAQGLSEKEIASIESRLGEIKQALASINNEILAKQEVLNKLKGVPQSTTKVLSRAEKLKQKQAQLRKEDNDTDKFSVSNIPADVKIKMEEAIAYLKSIVPFEVGDIDAIADRLNNKGVTFGAFIDNVIYLNKAAQAGTEYHEAFHAVMSLFSTEERTKYLEVAKKEHKITAKQRAEFKIQRPVYQNYTDAELDKIILEEYLADKFMAWKQGKKEPNGFFAKMFDKIKNFFNKIKDYFEGNLEALFHRIDSGKYKNASINQGTKVPYYMALPYMKERIKGTDEITTKKLNSTEETDLINSIRAEVAEILVDSLETGKIYTIKEAFDKVLATRDVVYSEAIENTTKSEEFLEDYYNKNAGLFEIEGVKEALFEKVKSQVQFLLSIDEDINDRILDKEETEGLGDYERNALQNVGISSMSQYVRLLLATAYVEKVDELGTKYKKGLNVSRLYTSMGRTLLNTKPENFMQKLEVFSTYNPEVRDFLVHFKQLLNWNSETESPGLNNKGEIKNQHIWNSFKKAFQKYRVGSITTLVYNDGKVKILNSNNKDVDTQQVEKWKIGYKNFVEKNYHEIEPAPFNILQSTKSITDEKLEEAVREIKLTLDSIGIKLSPLYIEYSILVNKPASTEKQELLMSLYENFNGLNGINNNNMDTLLQYVNKQIDPFREGDEGAMTRLKNMAMENASFDETAGSSTFQNAEGELVGDTSLGSFFLKRTAQLQQKEARSQNEEVFEEYYADQEDSWMIPLHFMATQNNPLYKHEVTFDKNFVFSNIDGVRPVKLDKEGNEIDTKEGVVFKHMLPLEKILTFMALYSVEGKSKTTKEGKKVNYAYYYPQVIETASTGYAILLPVNTFYTEKGLTSEFYTDMLSFVKNEHARIKYVAANSTLPKIENFNVGAKNGFKFFTNSWLTPVLQAELIALENLDNMSDSLKKRLKDNIDAHVEKDFQLTMDTLVREGVVNYENGEYTSDLVPESFRDGAKVNLAKIRSMQANYLVNGQAFNILLHGDLAYKIKSPEDHVKRLKGAHGAFSSLYGEEVSFEVLPDEITYKYKKVVNGIPKFFDVTPEIEKLKKEYPDLPMRDNDTGNGIFNKYEEQHLEEKNEVVKVDENEKTNAQAFTDLAFQETRLKGLGKFPPAVARVFEKLKQGEAITKLDLDILEKNDALLNPKKDLANAPNAYVKMSVHTLIRELTSYKVGDEWKALPGREREHAHLNKMEDEATNILVYKSGSKGTTILNKRRVLNGDYYGEQVITKGVKTKITDGTQQLALIWSELPEEVRGLVDQLDEADAARIVQSTEYALSMIKDGDVLSLKKILPSWYNGLVATGASPQLLDIFRPNAEGKPSLNPNLSISVDKFTAMYLAHWSNNALKQKVAGAKFTLVTPMKVIEYEGKVVRAEQFKANPEKYKGIKPRDLGYNMEGTKDGKKILYSECIVSAYYKELYNLKEGDEIPEELAYMMGYRIPTEDKPSMVVLKVVDFMPAIYGNAIMVPEEIQYLSGADFDIDSLFVQKYDIYEKDGKFHKYGSATTPEGQFEEFLNYVKNETDVEAYQKALLDESEEYQKLLEKKKQALAILTPIFEEKAKLEKENAAEIKTLLDKLDAVKEYTTSEEILAESKAEIFKEYYDRYAELDDAIERLFPVRIHGIFKKLNNIKANIDRIKANKLASALRYYKLPASKTAWVTAVKEGKYPKGKFKAALNNELLDIKIEMLGNAKVQETLASEKTSNEPLIEAEKDLRRDFPTAFSAEKPSLGFFSFNDLAVAMANNDAGSDGIGPAAVFNVVYQYLAKVNTRLDKTVQFNITGTSNDSSAKLSYYQFRGFSFDKTRTYVDSVGKRIGRSISAVISAMTDNAKDPIAAKLNLNDETLGPVLMMLGVGVEFKTALKIVNTKIVKDFSTEILKAKSDFTESKQFTIVQAAVSKTMYIKFTGENQVALKLENLDAYLTDPANDIEDTANIALKIYLNARDASQYMLLAKDILSLRKGVPSTFSELNKVSDAYDKLVTSMGIGPINGLPSILDVAPVQALTKGLMELRKAAETFFISQNPTLKRSYEVVKQQTRNSSAVNVEDGIFKAFNSFMSLGIFRQYLKDAKAGKTKKYKARFLDTFLEAFTKEALFESTLIAEVENIQKNATKLGLQNNRFVRYINTVKRENNQQVDRIEGNTRQLRDVDYQQELINGFDDLYANPLTRDTAIKLFAYILLKDGARYRNASFQSEIPSYMFSIYSDALNEFQKNPKFVDTKKLSNEFIEVWSLSAENNRAFHFVDNDLIKDAVKSKTLFAKEGTLTINLAADNFDGPMIAAGYNFIFEARQYKPTPFIKVGKNLYVIDTVNDKTVTDLTNLDKGIFFTYTTVEKKYKVSSLNAKARGVSAYSFPLNEALGLFAKAPTPKSTKIVTETRQDIDEFFQAQGISDMPATDSTSASWEATQLEESLAKPVTEAQYKEIKEAETAQREFTPENITSLKPNEIYSQLGNKTKSENVVIKSWEELKDVTKAILPQGIVSTRIKRSNNHFGNPFTSDTRLQYLIQTSSTKEAVEKYINWVLTGETGESVFTGIQPEELDNQREWILEQLQSGELKGKPILYYKELKEPSHATALDYLINKYNWNKNQPTTSQTIVEKVLSPTEQLKQWGITIATVIDNETGEFRTEVTVNKDADDRTKNIVAQLTAQQGLIGGTTMTEISIFTKLKEADTKETLKKLAEC